MKNIRLYDDYMQNKQLNIQCIIYERSVYNRKDITEQDALTMQPASGTITLYANDDKGCVTHENHHPKDGL